MILSSEFTDSEMRITSTFRSLCQAKAFLFLFAGLHHLPHFDFGKSKNHKSQEMLAGCDKIVPNVSNHFKMFKIEIIAHYLIFWTKIVNFLAVQVIL